jgi:hypothetical protein
MKVTKPISESLALLTINTMPTGMEATVTMRRAKLVKRPLKGGVNQGRWGSERGWKG